jgi:hypothetical protein
MRSPLRFSLTLVALTLCSGAQAATNFYAEYAALVDIARAICPNYLTINTIPATQIEARYADLGTVYLGREMFDAQFALIRTKYQTDARSMGKKAWCTKTKFEIVAHGDRETFID